MMRFIRLFCVLIAILSFDSLVIAQNLGTGLYAFGSFDSRGFDSINIGNLNTHFEIPIVNKQGRGLNFDYIVAYDGLIWSPQSVEGVQQWQPDSTYGFHGQLLGGVTGYVTYSAVIEGCRTDGGSQNNGLLLSNYVYHDSFGRSHLFNYSAYYCPNDGSVPPAISGDGSTSDGSGYQYGGPNLSSNNTDGLVHTRSGSTINAPSVQDNLQNSIYSGTITDSNGNTITNDGNGHFTDTLGVQELTLSGSGTASSPLAFTYKVAQQSDGSPTATATVYYRTYSVQTNFQCSGIGEYSATTDLVDHIQLADGDIYSFSYEPTPGVGGTVTGRLASVTLPTGGAIVYSYTGGCNGNSGINPDGTVGSLARTTSDGTRSYTRAPINTNATSTALQDEKGNQALYQFSVASGLFYETHRSLFQGSIVYQGNFAGAPNLYDVYTCYNGDQPNCEGGAVTLPITGVITRSSFNNGNQLQTLNSYNNSGLLTQSIQQDFQNGQAVLTKTNYSYNPTAGVSSVVVTDGSGNTISSATYGYDETAPTATSGIPQHTTGISGGNQTSSHIQTGSGTIDTTTAYYDTGVPVSTTNTNTNSTTSYGYDATQTFATTTTLPTPSSGVQLATSANYDQSSGALLSTMGMNAEQTQVSQYDRLLRPTIVSLPNGGQINYNYQGSNQVGQVQSMGGGQNADTEILYDEYGRLSRVAVLNGQSWYQTDYCYDATGLLQFQSVRYEGSGFAGANATKQCSGNGTSYTHDALGRVTSITNSDGTAHRQYNGRAVETIDVNNVQRITQHDTLGRISSICELSPSTTLPQSGTPTPCGMELAGTGFLTNYSYTAVVNGSNVVNQTTITQGIQTRIFQTDLTGRPVSATEPERGMTNYSYAYNSTGLKVTRTRPKANQTVASTLTTTITQYDSLGRVLSINYDDQLTPSKQFLYDTAAPYGWPNASSALNLKGRLAIMGALTGIYNDHTGAQYSYDPTGNVTQMWQCSPTTCSNAEAQVARPIWFSYDLAGNLTGETDYASGAISYGRSPAGEVTSITNGTFQTDGNPPNLVSNIVNGAYGPVSYLLGNGLDVNFVYDSMGRLYGQWVCSNSLVQNCAGGSQTFGYTADHSGSRITAINDTVLNEHLNLGYDEFDRLTSTIGTSLYGGNNPASFSYSYDRYGNRWNQSLTMQGTSGPQPSYTINTSNNQVQATGFSYDAAGNLITDGTGVGSHAYTYDAEGKILQVDGGGTAQYVYDALDHRIRQQTSSATYEYSYDYAGRLITTWDPTTNNGIEGRIYWDGKQIAYRTATTFFEHQDYVGTERMRTDYTGAVAATFTSMPWGDNFSPNILEQYGDRDNLQFAQLQHDGESSTEHAQFRQYSSTAGRWMSPDPYDGSYRFGNPQSFNRYSYVMNRPLSGVDPLGLDCERTSINIYDSEGNLIGTASGVDTGCEAGGGGGSGTAGYTGDDGTTDSGDAGTTGGTTGTGQSSGGASAAPSNTINQTTQPKSPARQQCEQQAQQQLDSTMQALDSNFLPNASSSAKEGAVGGGVAGCVFGAILTSPTGPGAVAGCIAGASTGFINGYFGGAFASMGHTIVNGLAAKQQYAQQIANVCSKL